MVEDEEDEIMELEIEVEQSKPAAKPTMKNFHELWAEHMALNPGPYRINESCDSKHNEAWRKWVRRKLELQEHVNIEKTPNITKKSVDWHECQIAPPPRFSTPGEKTAEEYLRAYHASLKFMEKLQPRSIEWRKERSRAYNLRNRLLEKFASESEIPFPVPKLPEVPKNDNPSGKKSK